MTNSTGPTDRLDRRVGTGRRRATRTAIGAAAALLAIVLIASGCSGGDDDAASTTTTSDASTIQDGSDNPDQGNDQGGSSTVPLQTVPDDQFDQVIVDLQAKVDGAGDTCGLLEVVVSSGNLPVPSNATQTQQAVELLSGVLKRLGASPPPGQEAAGAALSDAADKLLVDGEQSGWDPSTFGDSDTISAEAQTALGQIAATCPNLGGGTAGQAGGPQPSG